MVITEPQAATRTLQSPRILVIEDDSQTLVDIESDLPNLGYTIAGIAPTPGQGIERIETLRPDLVLMDAELAGAMPAAASIQERWAVPVVYLTADADIPLAEDREGSNPFGFLVKPLSRKAVRSTIEMALYRFRLERDLREARQRLEALAQLGLDALSGTSLTQLFDEACATAARALDADLAALLEIQPGGHRLLLRSGIGWHEGLVGSATIEARPTTMEGCAVTSKEPVIVEDLATDSRYPPPPLLVEHGVVSSLTVVVEGRKGPYGVLGVGTTERRTFAADEVHLIQALANTLALAVDRKRDEEELILQATILDNVRDSIIVTDLEGKVIFWNTGATHLFGYSAQEMLGKTPAMLYPEHDEAAFRQSLSRTLASNECFSEWTGITKEGRPITVEKCTSLVRNRQGHAIGFLGVCRDVTERKGLELTIRQLSLPILQVREQLLLVPLIGVIDSMRARELAAQLLAAVRTRRARAVVMDLTGVVSMDRAVAQRLAETAEAVRLLGATIIVTGVTSTVAHILVDIGENLRRIHIAGDLQGGIEEAEHLLGSQARGRQPARAALPDARRGSGDGPIT